MRVCGDGVSPTCRQEMTLTDADYKYHCSLVRVIDGDTVVLNVDLGFGIWKKDTFRLYGIDFSLPMLEHARKYADKFSYSPELFRGDIRYLPFADNTFDHAIAIATYHHIESPADRMAAFEELFRILKPGSEAFITLWNRWQKRRIS